MHRTVVCAGVDPDLDRLRHVYDGMEHMLNRVSREIASTVPKVIDVDLTVVFFPQIGFLIAVPLNVDSGRATYEGGIVEGERWEAIFSSARQQYFKDTRMRDLDATWGDLYSSICGRN